MTTNTTRTAPKKTAVTKSPQKSVAKKASRPVVKKTTARKAVPKSTEKKELKYADNDTSFWVADGQILNSLVALRDALSTMEKHVYAHHVTKEKNDFANWVAVVLDDAACARDLLGAKTPVSAKTVVVRHLKLYSY